MVPLTSPCTLVVVVAFPALSCLQIRALKEALVATTATTSSVMATVGANKTPTTVAKPQLGSSPNNLDVAATTDEAIEEGGGVSRAEGGNNTAGRRGDGETGADSLRLRNAKRELENLREREEDAKGEAERAADELQRLRFVCVL